MNHLVACSLCRRFTLLHVCQQFYCSTVTQAEALCAGPAKGVRSDIARLPYFLQILCQHIRPLEPSTTTAKAESRCANLSKAVIKQCMFKLGGLVQRALPHHAGMDLHLMKSISLVQLNLLHQLLLLSSYIFL